MDSGVVVDDVESVRWITFSRPEKLNALSPDDLVSATEATRDASADPSIGAIMYTGSGTRAFSAGMHIDNFVGLSARPADTKLVIGAVRQLLDTARTVEVPTICAVNGYCLGAAMELAAVCDLRVAGQGAQFGLPEINVGLPCILDSALLSQYVGLSRAKEIILTGDLYGAAELQTWGFLNRVVPEGEVVECASKMARDLAAKSRCAMASQKRLFELWQNVGLQESNYASVDEVERVFENPETTEIVHSVAARLGRS